MAENPWDERAQLWFLVRQVASRIDRAGEALIRAEVGISLPQFLVLSVVDAYPGDLNQQAVADRLGLTKGTVSRQIDLAVAAGLMTVEPSAHSRRENSVALTEAGAALVVKGDAALADARSSLLPDIAPADLAATLRALSTLNTTLGGPPVPF